MTKAQEKSGQTVSEVIDEVNLMFEGIRKNFEDCGRLSVGVFNINDMRRYKAKEAEAIELFTKLTKKLLDHRKENA